MDLGLPMVSNDEKEAVWKAFRERKPIRVPVALATNPRIIVLDPKLNTKGLTYERIFNDPLAMLESAVLHERHRRTALNRYCDSPFGLPEEWSAGVTWQNTYEARFFGAEWHFRDDQVPDTLPCLGEADKHKVFDVDVSEPLKNPIIRRGFEFHERMLDIAKSYTFDGRRVKIGRFTLAGTDGPVTTAMSLRGRDLMTDFILDPEFVERLLDRIIDAAINRVYAFRKHWKDDKIGGGLADDSIQLLSTEMYRRMVLPRHKRYFDEFFPNQPRGIHLCGDVMRHIKLLRDELNINSWDSGFPVDFAKMRRELGPDFQINGGPGIMLLTHGAPDQVYARTVEILESGIKDGGRFVLTEANNLPPCVPEKNLAAMYRAALDKGGY